MFTMRLLLLITLLVGAKGQVYDDDCTVSSWSKWTEWASEGHDPSVSSFPVYEKTGVGTKRRLEMMEMKRQHRQQIIKCTADGTCPLYLERPSEGPVTCVDGFANDLECWNVNQRSFLNISMMHYNQDILETPHGSDNWGWTDPENGDEYAIFGLTVGTTFIRITDPENPVVVGHVETNGLTDNIWRDIKLVGNYAYIVSELADHGMQIFDMHRLRGVTTPTTFLPDAFYGGVGNCHNIVSDEETGYVYAVGCTYGDYPNLCQGGLHVVNVQDPLNPTFEGCFGDDGYTHDAQCLIYRGPDTNYYGRELCFAYNEDTFTIVDVTDKANMVMVSRSGYGAAMYTHQGWLTEDHTIVLLDDELDEVDTPDTYTKTYIWDVRDLSSPVLMNTYRAAVQAIDHNQYIKGGYVYQSNYQVGLRILSIDQANYELTLIGHFDAFPGVNDGDWAGAWNVYPYFNSGNLILSLTEYGLYTLMPDYAALERAALEHTTYRERRRYRDILAATDIRYCPRLVDVQKMV